MKEYLVQGLLGVYPDPKDENSEPLKKNYCPSGTDPDQKYVAVGSGYRIEIWDRDNRFDDRLGAGKTTALPIPPLPLQSLFFGNQGTYFEIRFSDEALRQESGETETLENSEIFFKVFKGSQLLFSTEDNPSNIKGGIVGTNQPVNNGYCYKIPFIISEVETEEPKSEPRTQEIPIPEDRVVDILPTADQIRDLGGRRTSVTTNTSVLGGSLQQTVDNAFGQVLGQTFRTTDLTNFRDSLSQTFAIKDNNGQRAISYSPRSYVNNTQTELGGTITGAQASLYHRAKVALKEILPLLKGIYELEADSDKENQEAIRSIIRTEITEVVNEMGLHQGPRVQRVDSLFELLIGTEAQSSLPEQIGGQLKDFSKAFGLERAKINTVEEEQNYGNFLIIRDYIVSLRRSWQDYVSLQLSGAGSFVGTQLVLLSQALLVMAESVKETYHIMDLMFLGAEERESVFINFTNAKDTTLSDGLMGQGIAFLLPNGIPYSVEKVQQLVPGMEVEKLLSWAMRFAREEGPTLAKSGGKLGIAKVIAETARTLVVLIQAASYVNVPNNAFRREGVKRALRDLAFQTYRVQQLAEELIPPLLSGESDDVGDDTRNPFSIIKRI